MNANLAMTRHVVCIGPDDSLADAYEVMTEWEIRHLPVVRGNVLVGILSDRDVILRSTTGPTKVEVPSIPVAEAMTVNPLVCRPSASVGQIGRTMIEHKIDSLPVVDDSGALVGLVTSTDLIRLLVENEQIGGSKPLPFSYKIHSDHRGPARPW